jgi:DNA-binding response OmpR family regulator
MTCNDLNERLAMKKKILLADDDSSVRNTLRRVLESENYDVVTSGSGRETGAKFIEELPDLVLLDLTMPDRNGWEVFELINGTHPLVPVIIITARPHQYDHAADLGVDAIMEKPLDLPCLLQTIARFIAESEEERLHRLTRPDFHTVLLASGAEEGIHGTI